MSQLKIQRIRIDELIDVLMEARQKGEFVNLELSSDTNTLRIEMFGAGGPKPDDTTDFDNNINNLIG